MNERTFILETDGQKANFLRFADNLDVEHAKEIVVRDYVRRRSLPQNARLWKLHTMAAEITGYSAEEMHEFSLCRHYGFAEKEVTDPLTGEIVKKRVPNKRSHCRNKAEFRLFMEETEAWYIDTFGVWLDQQAA
jgi:hypothetical protein